MQEALEESFMDGKVSNNSLVDEISALRLRRKTKPLTMAENKELKRLVRIKACRDYRGR